MDNFRVADIQTLSRGNSNQGARLVHFRGAVHLVRHAKRGSPVLRLPPRMFVGTELLVVQRNQRVHLRGFSGWKQTCCEPDRENESCNGGVRPGVSR